MRFKRRSLYFFAAILSILFVLLTYLIATRNGNNTQDLEEIPEHLKVPLRDYPRQDFINYDKVGKLGSVHEHADIIIYVNEQKLDLSQLKYQLRDKFVHLEERRGDVIHKHATGITIGYFLSTLGFKFEDKGSCLVLDDEQKLCETNTKKLKVYVNNKLIDNYKDYEFFDIDKILVSYGSENEQQIQQILGNITDNAKIFSKK